MASYVNLLVMLWWTHARASRYVVDFGSDNFFETTIIALFFRI